MIKFDGSHIVEVKPGYKMFGIAFDINIKGEVVVFANSRKEVEHFVEIESRNPDFPLPFNGQNGNIDITKLILNVVDKG